MKYEISDFTSANAKRLKDICKRIVEYDKANGVPSATLKADLNVLNKIMTNLKKVSNTLTND